MSTFAQPAGPTSGLQSYDREGSKKDFVVRRKPRGGFLSQPTITPGAEAKAPAAKQESTMDKLSLFVPITKIDVEKRLVYGSVVAEEKDKAGEVFDYAGSKPYFEKWSQSFSDRTDGASVGNLRAMHNKVAAGKFTSISFDDAGMRIGGCAKVVDDAEWNKCLEGVYTGFSFGGKYVKRWQDPANPAMKRYIADPVEVSLVDDPCVKGATFEIVKANGDVEVRKFATVETTQDEVPKISNEQIATKATELAKIAGGGKQWSDFIDQARTELETAAKVEKTSAAETPKVEEKPTTEKPAEKVVTGEDAEEVGKQVWVSDELPGQQFAKKADLRKAIVEKAATAAAEKAVKPITDAVTKITAALDLKQGVDKTWKVDADVPEAVRKTIPAEAIGDFREAANVVLKKSEPEADAIKAGMVVVEKVWAKGADGQWSKKPDAAEKATTATITPIASKDDLKASLALFDKAANKNVFKRHLVRSARKLAATDLLPPDWPRSTDAKAEKSAGAEFDKLTGADAQKAVSLYSVANFIQLLASVESIEEMAEYQEKWPGSNNLPKPLCDRFGAVVVELGDIAAEMLDVILTAMRTEEATEAVERCAPVVDLMKIGARHSKGDVTKLNKAHDLIVELGATCASESDTGADKGVAAVVEKLNVMTAERDAFGRAFEKLAGTLATMAERVEKIDDTTKRIADQPVPRPLRVVEKTQDGVTIGGDAANNTKLLTDPNVLSGLAEMAVRAAQQNPRLALPDK